MQAFGESALAVDTHVHRLSLRWGLSAHDKNVDKVQLDLHRQFPEEHWNKIHLQMIYFGREYCTAKLHTVSIEPYLLTPLLFTCQSNLMIISCAYFITDLIAFHSKSKGLFFFDSVYINSPQSVRCARG